MQDQETPIEKVFLGLATLLIATGLVALAILLVGCAGQVKTWGAPSDAATAKPERLDAAARDVIVRAEYPDGRPVPLLTLRVADVSEGVWYPATRQDGTAPVSTSGLPLVSFSYRAAGETEKDPFRPLPPARRYGQLYVVTIPEVK